MASTSSSVTASSSTPGWTYDAFLSFNGPDTHKAFINLLYESLERKEIRTFKDDDRLEKGDCISPSLLKAIQESQFLIAVFSKGYASSKWCLEELATMMECHEKSKKQIVVPIFHNVEPSDVRRQEGSFGDSFKELLSQTQRASFGKDEEEEKVRRWKEALKNAGYLKGHHLQNDYKGYEATCAEQVAADIHAHLNQASLAYDHAHLNQASLAYDQENYLEGLESRVNNIIGNWLLATDYNDDDDARFIGICGMGGIGKTTIASAVFNRFSHQFDGACFLAQVRRHNIIELQKTILTKILKENSGVQIYNVQDGMAEIRTRLKGKKVLIVLDDVDNKMEQLDTLAGGRDWFSRGSRVIITTRDVRVLYSHGVDKKYVYEVHTLDNQAAIQLFSRYAFKSEIPPTHFEILSRSIVDYCAGLPLALKVLGSSLYSVEASGWKSILEKLKDTLTPSRSNDDIHAVLKISFDGLGCNGQKVFLHIACFFRHKKEEYVKDVLESCDLHPDCDLIDLFEKSLISILEGRIEMHDMIQDMGWRIAKEEKPRSRVWEFEEDGVLYRKMEFTKHIECILFPYTTYGFWRHNDENISSAFKALKILIGKRSYNEEEDNNFDYQLPSSLRWLHFPDYPFRSLPTSFHPSSMDMNPLELVGLCLHRSSLQNCWITKELNKLTYLDLSSSRSLLETPNFNMMPNLRNLDLSHCTTLKEIHHSVGCLKELVLLDVSHCFNLKKLPTFIQVSSLRFLKLKACSSENFPEIQKSIPLVLDLNLQFIRIRELPPSIRQLCGLIKLRLFGCENLVHLSDDLCELRSLQIFELIDCHQLESLPKNLGNLSKLEKLHVYKTAIFQLPSSITQLSSLECFCWGGNQKFGEERSLKFVPSVSGLGSLKRLQLSHFNIIDEGLPSDLGQCLISLEYLNLQGSNFGYLPKSFNQLPHLQYLDIRDCGKLEKLPELPKTIRELYVDSHFAFGNKSIVNIAMLAIKYPMLYSVSFSSCDDDEYDSFRGETFLAKKSIQFQFQRKAPFSVSYSSYSFYGDNNNHYTFLRSFKYRCYKSNRISFNLKPDWYSTQFVGFAVYFVSSKADIWGPHSYQDFDDRIHHCVIKAKLSSHNAIKNNDLETKCVIAGSTYYNDKDFDCETHVCFVYLQFSSLWLESRPMMEANDYSTFEVELVDLEASADWGINLLYKRPIGAREDMANYHSNDSGPYTTKQWELTEIVDRVQCQMVSKCSNAKVVRLLYTNSGAGILALSSDGIQKLWKWSYNEQNLSRKNWKPNSGPPMINDVSGVNFEEVVPCIALSNDDSYVVSAVGGKVSLFNIMTSEVTKTITSLLCASTFLAFDPNDNNIIAIGTEKSSIYIYDWVNKDLIELNEHQEPITGLAFSTKLKMLVSADADAQLCVWNTSLWKMRRSVRIQLPGGEVPSGGDTQVMFHVDQVHLLVTHETQLAVYDASKMELIHQCIPHVSLSVRISSATYSCNGQLIYASFIDGNIGVLDADTLTLKCRIDPSAYLPHQLVLNGSKDVYPLVIAAHPQEPNQFAVGLTDGSIKVIEPLESQGNWEVSVSSPVVSSPVDNGKKNGRLVRQVLRCTLATVCLGLFGVVGIIPIIQTKTRKSKMNFEDGSQVNRSDRTEQGEPDRPRGSGAEPSPRQPMAKLGARPRPIKARL